MGLFDSIKGLFNPEIISTYEELINCHSEAFRRWKGQQIVGTFSSMFEFSPTYNDKYFIATHKSEILSVEREIAEEKAFEIRKQKVINSASQYPHAFYALVKRLGLNSIPGINATLPGDRKSNRTKRLASERARNNSHSFVDPLFSRVDISLLINNRYNNIIYNPYKKERSINSLERDEYERLYLKLGELSKEESRIQQALKKEDIIFKFEDEILDNDKRSRYYKKFIDSRSIASDLEEYCISHLSDLDNFINETVNSEYYRIRLKYPLGIIYFENNSSYSNELKERVVENETKIASLDIVCQKYRELKKKYPLGLPALEKYYSYDDGKNSAELSIEEIVEREDEIKKFQLNAREADFYKNWEQTQADFSSKCRSLKDSVLSQWGGYKYDIPFPKIKENGDLIDGKFTIWQFFRNSYSEDDSVDLSYYPYLGEKRNLIPKLLSNTTKYVDIVYDQIIGFIEKLKEIYTEEDEIFVMFACNGHDNRTDIIDYHFKYLKEELESRNIQYSLIQESPLFVQDKVRYVIVDLVTTNEQLIKNASMLLNIKKGCRKGCDKESRFKCFSDIVYITLLKGFDKKEIQALNDIKIAEKKKEEERRKKQEDEIRRREEEERSKERERQIEKKRKINEISSLKRNVSSWNTICCSLPYNYLLSYYPTTCDFEASDEEWNNRWLVWNFKNTPGKTTHHQHEEALGNLIPRLVQMLKFTFGTDLSKLTLVCIPAATKANNETRFKEFSERLSKDTGMENAYGQIQIIKDATPKHLGGTGIPELNFDKEFFNGKYILLFDDVITKGNSMLRYKQKLESFGATVIAGLSIGKTKHER